MGMASRAFTPRFRITCFDLVRVRAHASARSVGAGLQLDVLADHPAQDALEVAHERVEIDHPRLEHLFAAEGQELVGHGRRLPTRLLDHLDVAAASIVEILAAHEQLRVAEDRREQVVEIVRHAPGQPPDGFHLLGLPELFSALPQGFLRVLAFEYLRDEALALAEETPG